MHRNTHLSSMQCMVVTRFTQRRLRTRHDTSRVWPPKITFLHVISESKQACFQPTVRQRSFYWSRFSSRGCKQTSECSRSREDLLWLVMFMNYAEYLRYLARVERGWRLIWSLLTKIDLENWPLLAVERWIKFNAILLYSTYGARDCFLCHRDACITSSEIYPRGGEKVGEFTNTVAMTLVECMCVCTYTHTHTNNIIATI